MNGVAGEAALDEIRRVLDNFPGPALDAATAAAQRRREAGARGLALGRLGELAEWLATWQEREPPSLHHPRTAIFAGSHGVVAALARAGAAPTTADRLREVVEGEASVNRLVAQIDGDLRLFEMDIDHPTRDFTTGSAMTEVECAKAVAYGMMAVEPGLDVLALGEMSDAGTVSAAALCQALFGGTPADWLGSDRLGGVDALIERGLEVNATSLNEPFEILRCLGGVELAAIVGAILAARLARTPIVLDGFACTAAAAILFKADKRALDHCVLGHLSPGPGHKRLADIIGKPPILCLNLGTDGGAGATLAIGVLQAAAACHAELG